ncbi:Hsp70 family protein [Plantactinospora sp. WMMB334]|uniref:Hsp70 family protein n=1 Tax=Plantactinospora sp. WMMB334 TaxID=3404119 RepID=UPI003B94D1B6
MATDGYGLGIDFGTSTTVAALAWPDGRVRPLLFDASPLLPSAVHAGPEAAAILTGADAGRASLAHPAGFDPNPKRRIDDGTVWLGGREFAVVDLIAAVLARVAAEAHRVAGQRPGTVVLTHPANWSRTRLGVLGDAAHRAGLPGVTFVAEPVAAAAYFRTALRRPVPPGRCIVVYDLGAGTFDVSAVRVSAESFDVVASAGLDDVGGLELDAAVVAHARAVTSTARAAWQRLDWPETAEETLARHTLWWGARSAKEQLSRHATATVRLPMVESDLLLTREEFEKAARPHLDRTTAFTVNLLREAGIAREWIGGVFLVGGSSRIPLAAALLHRTLGIAPVAVEQPELVVAEGSLLAQRPLPPAPVLGPVSGVPVGPGAGRDAPAPGGGRRRLHRRTAIVGGAALALAAGGGAAAAAFRPDRRRQPAGPRASDPAPVTGARFLAELTGHTGSILDLAFDGAGGDLIATGSTDQTIRLWSVANRGPVGAALPFNPGRGPASPWYVRGVRFSPDGSILAACGNDYVVRLWKVADRTRFGALTGHTGVNYVVAFSPDGQILASSSADTTIRLWDVARRRPLGAPLIGHTENVYALAYHPGGDLLASGGADHTVRLWDVRNRRQIGGTLIGHDDNVSSVTFSPDGRLLASTGIDRTVRLWDTASRQPLGAPITQPYASQSVAFSPDGSVLVSGGEHVRMWRLATRELIGAPLSDGTASVTGVSFSPDGGTLAGGVGNSLFLWEVLR